MEDGSLPEKLQSALKFRQWKAALAAHDVTLESIKPLALVPPDSESVLFAMLDTKVRDAQGYLPNYVVLRGAFAAVLVCLIDEDTQNEYLLLVKQRRIATGAWFYEHPAGMVDEDTNTRQVAVKEVEEETGLRLAAASLQQLNERPYYASPGLLDEGGYFYAIEQKLPLAQIQDLEGNTTGNDSEHERIMLAVVPRAHALSLLQNSNAALHYFLWCQNSHRTP